MVQCFNVFEHSLTSEIASRRRHCAHDADRALPLGVAEALDPPRPLVEGGQPRPEVRRVARVGGHLGQSAGDLTQRLGPTRRRVRHHGHVVALVGEFRLGEWDFGGPSK